MDISQREEIAMKKTVLVIREEDIKTRKKTPPPAKPHKKATAYRRKPKHPKRDDGPVSGPFPYGPLFLDGRGVRCLPVMPLPQRAYGNVTRDGSEGVSQDGVEVAVQ